MHRKAFASSRQALLFMAVVTTLGAATPAAFAATNAMYACVNNSSGQTQIVAAGTTCSNNATLVSWNIVGPQGATGAQGDAGPTGPTGPQGPSGTVATRFGSYGWVPTTTALPAGTYIAQDCGTAPYTAGAGETAITTSNVSAYFTTTGQRQHIAAYTVNGGALQTVPSNGMATLDLVGNTSVHGLLPLQQGSVYTFFPAIHADFAPAELQWVQCTTLVQVVHVP